MTDNPEEFALLAYSAVSDFWRNTHKFPDHKEASERWDLIAAALYHLAAMAYPKSPDVLLLADIAADHAETCERQSANAA